MNILRTIFPLLLILVVISSCRKDKLVVTETEIPPVVTVKYEIEVSGEVYNQLGEPISGASVNLGETFALTDDNGFFTITGLANENKAILSIEKSNYFTGHPVFYPEEGVGQHVRVELMDRQAAGTFNPLTNDLKIVNYGDHKIDFGNATLSDASGNAYSGNVNVYMAYLDPTSEDLADYMPGDLVGINTANEAQILKSYGMLNVELEDDAGNPLTMTGGEATMTMEIPSTLLGNAPASIPLWYFDTETGNWMEDGQATLQGSQYVGTVTHFTLWNCDAPFDLVTISGTINTELSPSTFKIKVIRPDGSFAITSLNESLRFEGKVPADEELTLQVIDFCGNIAYESAIGPYSDDQYVGVLDATATNLSILTISGTAVNCNSIPVNNGYAIISDGAGNTYFATCDNGYFETSVAWCSTNEVRITTYDHTENKVSETIVMDYDLTVDAGSIVTCDEAVAGIYISGPDVNLFFPAVGGGWQDNGMGVFEMSVLHDQGNGNKMFYTFTIISWTNDPLDPAITTTYTLQPVGDPNPIYQWEDLGNATVLYEIYNNMSGELIDVKYDNATIIEEVNGTGGFTYPGHTFRFVNTIE